MHEVTLREITRDNFREVMWLTVKPVQQRFIAFNSESIAEAHFHDEAWTRAVYADDVPVGFVMLHDENLREEPEQKNFYFLWRFMIGPASGERIWRGGNASGHRPRVIEPERH